MHWECVIELGLEDTSGESKRVRDVKTISIRKTILSSEIHQELESESVV